MPEWLDQRDILRMGEVDPLLNGLRHGPSEVDPAQSDTRKIECVAAENGLFCSLNQWRSRNVVEDRIIIRDTIGIQFVQSGNFTQTLTGNKRYVNSGGRVCITTYPGEVRQHRRFAANCEVRYIGAWIDPELLVGKFGLNPDQLPDGLKGIYANGDGGPHTYCMPLAPRLWLAVDEVFSTTYTGRLRTVYLTSKIHELICETVATLQRRDRAANSNHHSLSLKSRAAIDAAALIYMQELHSPPTLDELAARVGINRNKLSEGFQQLFNCSPHTYSKRLRMNWARQLLVDGIMGAQEIARAVGYSTQSAFSRAFSEHFGFPPSDMITSYDQPSDEVG